MARRTLDPSWIIIGGVVRAVPAIVICGFYLWMADFIDGNGGRRVDWFGPLLFGALFGMSAIFIIVRTFLKARAAASPDGPRNDASPTPMPAEPPFDAEAAIQRYLASKAAGRPDPEPPRAPFGKKPG